MRKIVVFNLVSLDGYYAGPKGEIDWLMVDDEFKYLLIENRITHEIHVRLPSGLYEAQ